MSACCICNKGPQQGVTVFRVNAKGVPGIWACDKHLKQTDAPKVDAEVREITRILENRHD